MADLKGSGHCDVTGTYRYPKPTSITHCTALTLTLTLTLTPTLILTLTKLLPRTNPITTLEPQHPNQSALINPTLTPT